MARIKPTRPLLVGILLAATSRGYISLPLEMGSWGRQLAFAHLPLGHEAARGSAAPPSRPMCWAPPAAVSSVDMGV